MMSIRMTAIFVATVAMMALKPVMIHLTRGNDAVSLPPQVFLLEAEGLKIVFCFVALLASRLGGRPAPVWRGFGHSARFAVPAAIYLVMNGVTVLNARRLEPAVFQLLANTKIIATAAASWFVMGRSFTAKRWGALVMLTLGVSCGQLREGWQTSSPPDAVMLMLLNSCFSAVAGVQAEKAMKARDGAGLSIFATNLHMASHTFLLNSLAAAVQAGFGGPRLWPAVPSWTALIALCSEAFNGILVSTLMREANSVVKNYAFSVSTFAIAGVSSAFFESAPSIDSALLAGAGLTVVSMGLYASSGEGAPSGKAVANAATASAASTASASGTAMPSRSARCDSSGGGVGASTRVRGRGP